jgi:hypothetical protein
VKIEAFVKTRVLATDPPEVVTQKFLDREALRIELRDRLIAKMDRQAIKFEPFTLDIARGAFDELIEAVDLEDWALALAQRWHAQVIVQMREAGGLRAADGTVIVRAGWNRAVPYCRNIPTPEMIREAGL